MTADDDLKLAWILHREGRRGRRDLLLTLAVASGARQKAPWARSVHGWLIAARPDHPFARFERPGLALNDRRMRSGLRRMRAAYPPAKVRWLLRRAEAASGPFAGRALPLPTILDDLLGSDPAPRRRTARIGGGDGPATGRDSLLAYYLTVLVGIASLCALVLNEADARRAA